MRRLWAMAALAVAGALGAPTGLAAAGSAPSEPVPTRAHAAPARVAIPGGGDLPPPAAPVNTRDGIAHCGQGADADTVWLTFDDSGTTAQISSLLATLKRENVKAIFFPIGTFALARPDLIALMKKDGHEVGSHSYSHPNFAGLSDTAIRGEVTQAEKAIKPTTTYRKFFRTPYGSAAYDTRVVNILSAARTRTAWTVDTRDWTGSSASTIVSGHAAMSTLRRCLRAASCLCTWAPRIPPRPSPASSTPCGLAATGSLALTCDLATSPSLGSGSSVHRGDGDRGCRSQVSGDPSRRPSDRKRPSI